MKTRLLLLVVILAGCTGDVSNLPTKRVTVASGQSLTSVAEMLEDSGLVSSAGRFKFWARLKGRQADIQAGIFDVPIGASMGAVLRTLTEGSAAYERVTVPEGQMIPEIARSVEAALDIPADSFIEATSDTVLLRGYEIPGSTAEGYLYPTTYHVPLSSRATEVVRQMLNQFESEWQTEWDRRAAELGYTRHEIVTLASIIEGEVAVDADRTLVSSVYHNRLRRGMRLQADPTVIYALGERRRLFFRDYRFEHPYNTYLIDGLPPGPIGSPSTASIEAALYPEETSYLYFVADSGGVHTFSETHEEHLQNVRRVQSR